MALLSGGFMPKTMLQPPTFKPYQHPKTGIIKCSQPSKPRPKPGKPPQTNGEEKMTSPSSSKKDSKQFDQKSNKAKSQGSANKSN
ncbi:hypothetical protein Pint_04802 [Pistacia integerrima]|uniref:Uncharacterized protein n=1 Tax=Pistacia integerrima TaxID=434235 RepID=A0ACC0Z696_9ROSI|nr:hypothetical protein Pint_04802 [Pistacia integerrima]